MNTSIENIVENELYNLHSINLQLIFKYYNEVGTTITHEDFLDILERLKELNNLVNKLITILIRVYRYFNSYKWGS